MIDAQLTEYQGYSIKLNSESGKWEIFWKEKKIGEGFSREADAEDWIDDQFPTHR
ncbi:MAG: hypothetical protein ACREQR_14070 [Candidatus Binataceae bacterium]